MQAASCSPVAVQDAAVEVHVHVSAACDVVPAIGGRLVADEPRHPLMKLSLAACIQAHIDWGHHRIRRNDSVPFRTTILFPMELGCLQQTAPMVQPRRGPGEGALAGGTRGRGRGRLQHLDQSRCAVAHSPIVATERRLYERRAGLIYLAQKLPQHACALDVIAVVYARVVLQQQLACLRPFSEELRAKAMVQLACKHLFFF